MAATEHNADLLRQADWEGLETVVDEWNAVRKDFVDLASGLFGPQFSPCRRLR